MRWPGRSPNLDQLAVLPSFLLTSCSGEQKLALVAPDQVTFGDQDFGRCLESRSLVVHRQSIPVELADAGWNDVLGFQHCRPFLSRQAPWPSVT
jgi:hypothetical protein